jgi:hypothetical protein
VRVVWTSDLYLPVGNGIGCNGMPDVVHDEIAAFNRPGGVALFGEDLSFGARATGSRASWRVCDQAGSLVRKEIHNPLTTQRLDKIVRPDRPGPVQFDG